MFMYALLLFGQFMTFMQPDITIYTLIFFLFFCMVVNPGISKKFHVRVFKKNQNYLLQFFFLYFIHKIYRLTLFKIRNLLADIHNFKKKEKILVP